MAHSKLYQACVAFLQSYQSLKADELLAVRKPTCTHTFVTSQKPETVFNNEELGQFYKVLDGVVTGCHFELRRIVENDKDGTAAMWCTATVSFKADVGPYVGDYVFFLEFGEDQDKAAKVIEIVDGASSQNYMDLIAAATKQAT